MEPLDAIMTKAEQRLMGAVMAHPDEDFGTLELLERMGRSRGAGSAVLRRWVDAGLLRERRLGNQRRLKVNPQFPLYPELRRMVMKTIGLAQPLAKALSPLSNKLVEAFVCGSVASGNDTANSDIDLVIVGDVDLFAVSPLLDAVQAEVGRPIHVSVYDEAEWNTADDDVLAAIKRGPRIDLMETIRGQTS
jgi:uncharacterized protein